jgi:hypothetical protein
MAHELQVRYSKLADIREKAQLVTKDNVIFNTRYEKDPVAGTIKIPVRGAANIRAYNKATGLNLEETDTAYITVTLDHDVAMNELIDGFDAAAVPDDVVADRIEAGADGFANTLDVKGLLELAKNGSVTTGNALTKSNVYDEIINARTALSKASLPLNGRYVIVTPEVYSLMLKDSNFVKASDLGQKIVETGAVGQIGGLNVYESVNLGAYEVEEDGTTYTIAPQIVAGHPNCATRVKEWAVGVHVQDLSGSGKYIGACAVQGRKVFTHKVTNKDGIFVYATKTAKK